MATKQATIQFKTKIKTMEGRRYIDFKRSIGVIDLIERRADYTYGNSDLFKSILQRAYDASIKNGKGGWTYVDDLPECVTIDDSKFMAVVTVKIEVHN